MIAIVGGWIAFVVIVMVLATRPWKVPAARAPLPWALAVAVMAWVLWRGALAYSESMAEGSWTGASVTIGFVPLQGLLYTALAYGSVRSFLTARATASPSPGQRALPVVLGILVVALIGADFRAQKDAVLIRHARDEHLQAAEVNALVERVRSGAAQQDELGTFLGNALCPHELLAEYGASGDPFLRKAVARNPKIDPELAGKLANDANEEVRYYLAFNRDLPAEILSQLSKDTSENVRNTVAWTKSLPDEDFARLVNDPSPQVRAAAARQSRISEEALQKLLSDPDPQVHDAATWQAGHAR